MSPRTAPIREAPLPRAVVISSEALFQKASKLPRVEIFAKPKRVLAKTPSAA